MENICFLFTHRIGIVIERPRWSVYHDCQFVEMIDRTVLLHLIPRNGVESDFRPVALKTTTTKLMKIAEIKSLSSREESLNFHLRVTTNLSISMANDR